MSTAHLFNDIWDDLEKVLLPGKQHFIDFLCHNAEDLGLLTAQSMLTIGPAKGSTDFALMKVCLPRLHTLIAVEPSLLINEMQTRFSVFPNILKKFEKTTLQDYKGPDTPVDIILFCHFIYYIMDDLEHQIRRTLDWLALEGVVIIIIDTEEKGSYPDRLRLFFSDKGISKGCSETAVETLLKKLPISYKKYRLPQPLHLSSDSAKRLLLDMLISRKATEKEYAINDEVLRLFINEDTGVVEEEQTVFILKNKMD